VNWDQVAGNFKQFKGHVKEKWGKLTDDDLDVIEGKKDQLVGRLPERYGYSKEQAEKDSRAGNRITASLSGTSCP
jgi:uncharacterized protein YjbJ (UPF0337 family)